jgi:predicted short-subunit dehydrogenase-like oxidoreductase (DUF2520 family)
MDNADQPIEDLGAAIGRANRSARRGDLEALERELSHLRRLGPATVATFATALRRLADSVRAHPSYRSDGEPTARAV